MRCSAEMEWRHGTWQCPGCKLKLGCCEGLPCRGDGEAGDRDGEPESGLAPIGR
jgi:hypothetical protein